MCVCSAAISVDPYFGKSCQNTISPPPTAYFKCRRYFLSLSTPVLPSAVTVAFQPKAGADFSYGGQNIVCRLYYYRMRKRAPELYSRKRERERRLVNIPMGPQKSVGVENQPLGISFNCAHLLGTVFYDPSVEIHTQKTIKKKKKLNLKDTRRSLLKAPFVILSCLKYGRVITI